MSPEKVGMLVVLDLKRTGNNDLESVTEVITAQTSDLPVYVDWTSIKEPQGAAYSEVGRGVAYVRFEKGPSKPQPIRRVERLVRLLRPNSYLWENWVQKDWLLLILILPKDYTLRAIQPKPMRIRAKDFQDQLVLVVWAAARYLERAQVELEIKALEEEVYVAAWRINDDAMSAEPAGFPDPIPDAIVAEPPLTKLRRQLAKYFKIDELRTLCFDLSIKYEDLAADTLDGMARELVYYCQRNGQIPALVAECHKMRPNVSWEGEYE